MGLFKRKLKMSIEEFCQQYYDSQIFKVKVNDKGEMPALCKRILNLGHQFAVAPQCLGPDGASALHKKILSSIEEIDISSKKIDHDLFWQEITAIRMELFGLVWTHMFWGKMEKFLWPQITFTKNYLVENGHQDIWDIMSFYNKAISTAQNRYINCTARSERALRAKVASTNSMLLDFYKLWTEKGKDKFCSAHILNRLWSEGAWKQGFILEDFNDTLATRLDWSTTLQDAVKPQVIVVLSEFYHFTRTAIKIMKIR
jgi:hypothetical protein